MIVTVRSGILCGRDLHSSLSLSLSLSLQVKHKRTKEGKEEKISGKIDRYARTLDRMITAKLVSNCHSLDEGWFVSKTCADIRRPEKGYHHHPSLVSAGTLVRSLVRSLWTALWFVPQKLVITHWVTPCTDTDFMTYV